MLDHHKNGKVNEHSQHYYEQEGKYKLTKK